MKFSVEEISANFLLSDGLLYRRYLGGHMKHIRLVDRGRVVVTYKGRRLFGHDLAWMLRYGIAPLWQVFQLNDDPHDFSEMNLMCTRLARKRYRATECPGGFSHPLSNLAFRTKEMCFYDWITAARRYYMRDFPYILERQAEMKERLAHTRVDVEFVQAKAKVDPVPKERIVLWAPDPVTAVEPRPNPVEGRMWRKYKGQWVSIPNPVHCSDDWRIRAEAVLVRPGAKFVYDTVLQRTVEVL